MWKLTFDASGSFTNEKSCTEKSSSINGTEQPSSPHYGLTRNEQSETKSELMMGTRQVYLSRRYWETNVQLIRRAEFETVF